MLRIRNEACCDTEDDHRIDLHVGVILGECTIDSEFLTAVAAFQYDIPFLSGIHPVDICR